MYVCMNASGSVCLLLQLPSRDCVQSVVPATSEFIRLKMGSPFPFPFPIYAHNPRSMKGLKISKNSANNSEYSEIY